MPCGSRFGIGVLPPFLVVFGSAMLERNERRRPRRTPLREGVPVKNPELDMATLRALRVMLERPSAPHHGYDLQLRTGVRGIYRVLQRLEEDGWAISEWMAPPGRGPARHVYRLTPAGRRWARKLLAETAALLAPPSLLQQTADENQEPAPFGGRAIVRRARLRAEDPPRHGIGAGNRSG